MRFSVDQASVADIVASLTSYSEDISFAFDNFQEAIREIAIRTNYNKMLLALQNIIDIYNNDVCGSMRERLINLWLEEGKSLHSFAEDVYMGEESEEAVRKIESHLGEIFAAKYSNSIMDLEFEGDPKATREDFNAAVACFEAFRTEVEFCGDSYRDSFVNKIEENELYRFLVPLVEAIGAGILSFTDTAKKEIERLGDNYVDKMASLKDKVEEAKKDKQDMDFDLDLFDFDSEIPRGSAGGRDGGGQKQADSVEEDQKYERLIQALKNFDSSACPHTRLIQTHDKHLEDFRKKIDARVAAEWNKFDAELKNYWQWLDKQCRDRGRELEARYLKGTLTYNQYQNQYRECCTKGEQLHAERYWQRQAEFELIRQKADREINDEIARCNAIVNRLQQTIGVCKTLYNNRVPLTKELRSKTDRENALKKVQDAVNAVSKQCKGCNKLEAIKSSLEDLKQYLETAEQLAEQLYEESKNEKLEAFGYPKIAGSLTWEENLKATNPGYDVSRNNGDEKYTKNCQRCVMAYEARCRGYDVTAKEKPSRHNDDLATRNGWPQVFADRNGKTPIPEEVKGQTIDEAIAYIEQRMQSYGDGARAIIEYSRSAHDFSFMGGHVFIAEQINGQTVFCDPQSGLEDAKVLLRRQTKKTVYVCVPRCRKGKKLGNCNRCDIKDKSQRNSSETTTVQVRPSDIRMLRVDNLKMTNRIDECCS